jgi:hypothetical protein
LTIGFDTSQGEELELEGLAIRGGVKVDIVFLALVFDNNYGLLKSVLNRGSLWLLTGNSRHGVNLLSRGPEAVSQDVRCRRAKDREYKEGK